MKPNNKIYIAKNFQTRSAKEIAQVLGIKEKVVRNFIHNLKEKEKQLESKSQQSERKIEPKTEKISWKIIIAIFLLGSVVYSNSLQGEFIWDDNILIAENKSITDWSHIKEVLTSNLGDADYYRAHGSYRPLQTVTYMIDYSLWGLDPVGYHLTNILLHLLTAAALYMMVFALLSSNRIAAITAMFFVVHPLHTETVAYISGRADSLSALFLILSFLAYIKCYQKTKIYIAPFIFTYVLALLSKESALMLVIFIVVYHFALRRKVHWGPSVTVLCVSGVYALLRASGALGMMALKENVPTTLLERIPGFFFALTTYLQLMLFPFNLHMEYGRAIYPFTHPKAIVGLVIFIALIFSAIKLRKRKSLFCFVLLWFILGLLPVSNTFMIVNAFMAEHWLYLPSIGIFLMIALMINSIYLQERWRKAASLFFAVLLCFWGTRTFQQNTYWREPISFFRRTLKYAPFSVRAYSDMAYAYVLKNQHHEAILAYEKALNIDPSYLDANNNLGNSYVAVGQYGKAIEVLNRALQLDPEREYIYFNLGSAYKEMGKMPEAVKYFEEGLALSDTNVVAKMHLAQAYDSMKEYQKAVDIYEKLIAEDPSKDLYHYLLGLVYKNNGQTNEAIASLLKAIKLNPGNADAYNELGIIYSGMGQHKEALAAFEKKVALGPLSAEAYSNLGVAYNNLGKKGLSISAHKKAIEIDPAYQGAYNNLAYVYNSLNRYNETVILLEEALELNPNNASILNNLGVAYQALGRSKEALEVYQKSLAIDPNNSRVHNALKFIKSQ